MTARRDTIPCQVCGQPARARDLTKRLGLHNRCKPVLYQRHAFQPCEICGQKARGRRHRLCLYPDANRCRYCGQPVAHAETLFHKSCIPAVEELYEFADLPGVKQRRCQVCSEFWPIGSEFWSTTTWNGRQREVRTCRACQAEQRNARRRIA